MSKVLFLPSVMWLSIAVSLVAVAVAMTAPHHPRRNAMMSTDKGSQVEDEIAQPTSASFLGTQSHIDNGYKHGYRVAQGLRSDDAMKKFIRRYLLAYGKTVNDDGALQGFVPWFSGTKSAQNFLQMKEQLFEKPWVVDASDLSKTSSVAREQSTSKNITASPFIEQDPPMKQYLQQYVHQYADDAAPAPAPPASPLPASSPHDAEERHGAISSREEASSKPTATIPAVEQEAPEFVPSPPDSATVPVAARRPGSVETPAAVEDLMLGVHPLVNSQSQIVNAIESKLVELKSNAGKADSINRKSLDEAKGQYQKKLFEQHMNTTRIRDKNADLDEDIKHLVSINAELRQQAQELRQQSLALRKQVKSAESNLTLAQEFAAKALFDDSSDHLQFLTDLRTNESELAKAHTHTFEVDHFGERSRVAFLQVENDTESVQLLHTVEHTFSELSVEANASKVALDQSFEKSFNQEAMVQESLLARQRALLDEKQEQLALRSKLTDAVAHADQMKTFLSNRILHLKSYALRLSRQR